MSNAAVLGELVDEQQRQQARAMQMHRRYPMVDGHNDLPHALRKGFKNMLAAVDLNQDQSGIPVPGLRHGSLHTDMVRLRKVLFFTTTDSLVMSHTVGCELFSSHTLPARGLAVRLQGGGGEAGDPPPHGRLGLGSGSHMFVCFSINRRTMRPAGVPCRSSALLP